MNTKIIKRLSKNSLCSRRERQIKPENIMPQIENKKELSQGQNGGKFKGKKQR